jgi:hypothetical protein
LKDTKKYDENRQLYKPVGYLHKDRAKPESSEEAPIISSMSGNKENNVVEYRARNQGSQLSFHIRISRCM